MDAGGQIESIDLAQTAIRLGAAALLAAVVGAEREWRDRSAGLRTHMLVSLGACAFTLASVYAFPVVAPRDPLRVAAQVVSGIGFVGAGVIIRSGASVKGLTTAASLWASAAVGMLAGVGMFIEAAMVSVALVFVLAVLRLADAAINRVAGKQLRMTMALHLEDHTGRAAVLEEVRRHVRVEAYASRRENGTTVVEVESVLSDGTEPFQIVQELELLAEIKTADVEVHADVG